MRNEKERAYLLTLNYSSKVFDALREEIGKVEEARSVLQRISKCQEEDVLDALELKGNYCTFRHKNDGRLSFSGLILRNSILTSRDVRDDVLVLTEKGVKRVFVEKCNPNMASEWLFSEYGDFGLKRAFGE